MMKIANLINTRKQWKPPYIEILILALLCRCLQAQSPPPSDEDATDDINITIVTGPFSLEFGVDDESAYELQNVSCKSVKSTEISLISCDNLNPCSAYLATLTIKVLATEEIVTKPVETRTDYAEPSVKITYVEAHIEDIYIKWEATNKTCISSYQIEVSAPGQDYKWTYPNDIDELSITSLNPCQEYQIELKSFSAENEQMVSNETATVTTLYADPGEVVVSVEPFNEIQMKVSWGQPKYWNCINYYYLKWYSLDCVASHQKTTSANSLSRDETDDADDELQKPTEADQICSSSANVTDRNAKQYIISGLNGCDIYAFEMYINNNHTLKSEIVEFTSPEQVPGKVTTKTPELGATNITLHWNAPEANDKCVLHYVVKIEGPINRDDFEADPFSDSTTSTSFFVDALDPCGKYNFSIQPVSRNGSLGPQTDAAFELLAARASPVRNVVAVSFINSVDLTWDPPEFADLCVSEYRLTGWSNDTSPSLTFDETSTKTSITIKGLVSCITYTVQIIPTTQDAAMDGELERIDFETEAAAPTSPSIMDVLGDYPDALEFSARVVETNNKCKTIFARFVCEISNKSLDVPYKSAEKYVEGKVGDMSFSAMLSPLSPNTDYVCTAGLFNVAGWSKNISSITKTQPYFPGSPTRIRLGTSTNHSVQFYWNEPKYANGVIKNYNLHLQQVEAAYYMPPLCTKLKVEKKDKTTSALTSTFDELLPYTKYSMQVSAQNEYGDGEYTRPYMVITKPTVSDPVLNLQLVPDGPYGSYDKYKASVTATWTAPCRSNGDIECFELTFVGTRQNHVTEQFTRTVPPNFNENGSISYKETDLLPEYTYIVSLQVRNKDVIDSSSAIVQNFEAPAGIPNVLTDSARNRTRVNAFDSSESNNPATSAVVYLPVDILESESGKILYIALLLSQKGCNGEPEMRHGALNTEKEPWPYVSTWKDAYNNSECITQYQTTPTLWNPNDNRLLRDSMETEIKYVIGTEKCDSSSTNSYCNGPLKADTEYYLVLRLFTRSGYNDAARLEFKTDSLIEFTLILIIVCSCLLLALIAGLVYLWITNRLQWKRQSSLGFEDSCGDVISKNFAMYYRDIAKPEKVGREFKELTTVAIDLSCSASELGCNKNRYADIFPYDKNRVILDIDADGSDYINASFIDGYRRKKEYIATQGPKPESVVDFWRMILQHNVRVIVMVTQFRELDMIKCHEYYPYKSRNINAMIKRVDACELYDRTELVVTHDKYGLRQKVVHFYFKKWPDHGCPSDPMHLISFVRKVKAEKIPNYSPIVIHCSAGVGRTGTFIALDIIMQRLKNESKVNIYETVKKLRFQRTKMVQSLAQYTFLYNCTYELVKLKNPRLNQKGANDDPKKNKKTGKKVSFEDDEDVNAASSMTTTPSVFNITDVATGSREDETSQNPKGAAHSIIPIGNNNSTESAM